MNGVIFGWLAGSTAVFMAANAALKSYAQAGGVWMLVAALALFCVGNACMVQVMRANGLGIALSLSLVFQLIAITVLALVVFGERPTAMQMVGIGFGVLAVALIALGGRA
jgi:small multidrug resistance pump